MAIVKRDFPTASTPSYTPSISTDYNNQNEYIEGNAKGYNSISLTNWDATTTKPQVAAGTAIEINGVVYDFTTATDIDTSGASAGTIYLYFDDGTPEFKFLDTAPTWSATLNGWYTSGDRFTGHLMEWDGSTAYSGKIYNYDAKQNTLFRARGFIIDGGTVSDETLRYGSSDVGNYVFFDPGLLYLRYVDNNTDAALATPAYIYYYDGTNYKQILYVTSGLAAGVLDNTVKTVMFSNGNNYCAYHNTAISTGYIDYFHIKII